MTTRQTIQAILVASVLLAIVPLGAMAQTGTLTADYIGGRDGPLRGYSLTWAANASGEVSATTAFIEGTLERWAFIPGTGAAQPTDLYDVTLVDRDGFDVLAASGANLSNTTATDAHGNSGAIMATAGPLTLSVTNAGDSNAGIIRLYMRP